MRLALIRHAGGRIGLGDLILAEQAEVIHRDVQRFVVVEVSLEDFVVGVRLLFEGLLVFLVGIELRAASQELGFAEGNFALGLLILVALDVLGELLEVVRLIDALRGKALERADDIRIDLVEATEVICRHLVELDRVIQVGFAHVHVIGERGENDIG